MECNKEEANRAKGIAEKKMENRDFAGARRIAQRAQHLFPDIDNIGQIITVCDVHCAAEIRITGSEMDWYGILQVEQTADDSSIRKQYKKLALQLHPDKNKFAGAESAFKLIGEAFRVLTEPSKRAAYDIKRKYMSTNILPKQSRTAQRSNMNFTGKQSKVQNNLGKSSTPQSTNCSQKQNQQSTNPSTSPTFWTICPFCRVSYQYYTTSVNRVIPCHNCKKPFIACDINFHVGAPGVRSQLPKQSTCYQQKNISHGSNKVNSHTTNVGTQRHAVEQTFPDNAGCKESKVSEKNGKETSHEPKSCSVDQKSGRNEPFSFRRTTPYESDNKEGKMGENDRTFPGFSGDSFKKPKLDVSFNDSLSLAKEGQTVPLNENPSNEKGPEKVGCDELKISERDVDPNKKKPNGCLSVKTQSEPELISYPEPEFYDFDQDRREECFAIGQLWAVYDNVEGMPRYYAWIRNVYTSKFRLRITWLEADPKEQQEIRWCEEELPIACGNFILGKTEVTVDRLMFSHLVSWEKGRKRSSYLIYPRKGEIWAMFKDWDIKWSSDPDSHKQHEFKIVQILSDYSFMDGVEVIQMAKVKGFVSLYQAVEKSVAAIVIPASDLLCFSHRIPSFRLAGDEKVGIQKGSFELDPASLPDKIEDFDHSTSIGDAEANNKCFDGHCNDPISNAAEKLHTFQSDTEKKYIQTREFPRNLNERLVNNDNRSDENQHNKSDRQKNLGERKMELRDSSNIEIESAKIKSLPDKDVDLIPKNINIMENGSTSPTVFSDHFSEYPESQFYDFTIDRSEEKIQPGQIWAVYCDIDTMPKFYALVKCVETSDTNFKVHIIWLEACPVKDIEVRWFRDDLTISCGVFRPRKHMFEAYSSTGMFSHLVKADPTIKPKNRFKIYPKNGEIWAVYKDWTSNWTLSNMKSCEYQLVVIIDSTSNFEALPLEKVNGYRAVFRTENGTAAPTVKISWHEVLRFSHQVPAYRLTEDRCGPILKDCWELDPASVPPSLLFSEGVMQ